MTNDALDQAADEFQRAMRERAKIRYQHIEMLAGAYLKKTDLQPDEVELVEEQRGFQTVWYFRKREARGGPDPV